MIPRTEVEVLSTVPPAATFWVPDLNDIFDEGIGFFRGTWTLIGVDLDEAGSVFDAEGVALAYADQHSSSAAEFEEIAHWLETSDDDSAPICAGLDRASSVRDELGGLEIGVAGLVYSLCARYFITAASCRGHHGVELAWSDVPVVYFAGDREQVYHLQPLVERSGCSFEVDPSRPDLIAIVASSVLELRLLASLVLEDSDFPFRDLELPE